MIKGDNHFKINAQGDNQEKQTKQANIIIWAQEN